MRVRVSPAGPNPEYIRPPGSGRCVGMKTLFDTSFNETVNQFDEGEVVFVQLHEAEEITILPAKVAEKRFQEITRQEEKYDKDGKAIDVLFLANGDEVHIKREGGPGSTSIIRAGKEQKPEGATAEAGKSLERSKLEGKGKAADEEPESKAGKTVTRHAPHGPENPKTHAHHEAKKH